VNSTCPASYCQTAEEGVLILVILCLRGRGRILGWAAQPLKALRLLRAEAAYPITTPYVRMGKVVLDASDLSGYTISRYKLSFWAAASAQRALAAAVRARPPAGRARPSPLHIKKALTSKWY